MSIKKKEFIKCITQKLNNFYTLSNSASIKKSALGNEITGFLEAGILLNVISKEEFISIADQEHISIHGKSLRQREIDDKTNVEKKEIDWDRFEEPTYIRKNKK